MQKQFKQTVLEIRFLELQVARSPSTGFEPAALMHLNEYCST
jgi:hypothetical protein